MNPAKSDHEAKMTIPGTQRSLRIVYGPQYSETFGEGLCHRGEEEFYAGEPDDLNQHFFGLFARREVGAVGVMEYQRADARLWLHHHALCEPYADFVRLQ